MDNNTTSDWCVGAAEGVPNAAVCMYRIELLHCLLKVRSGSLAGSQRCGHSIASWLVGYFDVGLG